MAIERPPFTIRILPAAKTRLEELALRHSLPAKRVTVSDVVRASLAVAANHPAELDKAITAIRGEQA